MEDAMNIRVEQQKAIAKYAGQLGTFPGGKVEINAWLRELREDDPMLFSLLNAPPDDEPYTDQQRAEDAEASVSIARGEGISQEEILREFGSRS